jgi:hypothetical protein
VLQTICLAWGTISIIGMIIAFFPCLGALNWLNIPLSGLGLIFCSAIQFISRKKYNLGSLMGIVLCGTAVGIGLLRLGIGFGIL